MSPGIRGAVAGLAPATVILGYYLVTGGPLRPGLLVIAIAALVAGWLVGPMARGTANSDFAAFCLYFAVGYFLERGLQAALVAANGLFDGARSGEAVASLASLLAVTFVYLPVWALFLSPAALAWIVTVGFLRRLDEADG